MASDCMIWTSRTATGISTKANIYKGRITRVEPSLEAAFVDFGADRHGFLPLKEISPEYFQDKAATWRQGRQRIRESGQGRHRGHGAGREGRARQQGCCAHHLHQPGWSLPGADAEQSARRRHFSRRIEGDERSELREALNASNLPDGMGIIIRTAGVGRSAEELQWDLDYLLHLWQSRSSAAADAEDARRS
jgi:ribonuclease E